MDTNSSKRSEPLVLAESRDLAGGTATVLTLNRPEQRNPLDKGTVRALNDEVDAALADDTARAVIITGAPPAFSAGGDLRGYLELYRDPGAFRAFLEDIRTLFDKLEQSRLVSVAAVNGTCVAGGFEMTLACDLVVMSDDAKMGDGHLKYWQLPGGGGSQRLPRAIGTAGAKRLLLTQELLSAEQCLQIGLVADVSTPASLLDEAVRLADRVTTAPEATIVTLKDLLGIAENSPLSEGIGHEIDTLVNYTTQPGGVAYQGLERFLQRRR